MGLLSQFYKRKFVKNKIAIPISLSSNPFFLQADNNGPFIIYEKRNLNISVAWGGAVADWSKALLLREKINTSYEL